MMLFDLGVNVRATLTSIEIRWAINHVEDIFDIVMIAEKMDESLILLKEYLCWDLKDVVFFSKKNNRYRFIYYRFIAHPINL